MIDRVSALDGDEGTTQGRSSRTEGELPERDGFRAVVVDDHPAMCKMVGAMLRQLGYHVSAAPGGPEALFHLERSGCCELLLTDYQMPTINGYQLGRRAKTRCPGTRVVIMTGMSRAEITHLMEEGIIDGWLFKPFFAHELETLLTRLGLPVGFQRSG